jgi:hypothetical protein
MTQRQFEIAPTASHEQLYGSSFGGTAVGDTPFGHCETHRSELHVMLEHAAEARAPSSRSRDPILHVATAPPRFESVARNNLKYVPALHTLNAVDRYTSTLPTRLKSMSSVTKPKSMGCT